MPPEPSSPPAPRAADPLDEPCREDCPWCGSPRLRTRLRAPAPGTFAVDECLDCDHVFQNPRLTAEGLVRQHRYRFDDDPEFSAARGRSARRHRAAARALLRCPGFPEPESWLDVGTGHAHFPHVARELLAYTSFDGLDATVRVLRARAADRVEEAHVGRLTDPPLTARLRARYDVVSMFGHLEHTPDPRAELDAALAVLRPGGHLLVELPGPGRAFTALLDRWWFPRRRSRHLHLIPPDNLRAELEYQGCTILTTARRAHYSNAYRVIARKNTP